MTSQDCVRRNNGKLLATENDRMGACYGCYKPLGYISVLSTVLTNIHIPFMSVCLLGSVVGALGGCCWLPKGFGRRTEENREWVFCPRKVVRRSEQDNVCQVGFISRGCSGLCQHIFILKGKSVRNASRSVCSQHVRFIHQVVILEQGSSEGKDQGATGLA